MNSPAVAPDDTFIGRQPILDQDHATLGYELLFRGGPDNRAHVESAVSATADVVCKAFAELGLSSALGPQRAFINVDANFLLEDSVELLPSQTVVLEIDCSRLTDARLEQRMAELREKGYSFCIACGGHLPDTIPSALPLASYAKIDVPLLGEPAFQAMLPKLVATGLPLIASRVENYAQMRDCAEMGFRYFQGYYFARPALVQGKKLDASAQSLIKLINLINSDAETGQIENALKHEPALSMNLLRLANSVAAGFPTRFASVRHAVTALGRRQIQRWLQLLLFSQNGRPINRNPLMQLAALKGYFMELVAGRHHPARKEIRDQAFLAGIMSLMPAMLGISMDELLKTLSVAPEIEAALLQQSGDLGLILSLTDHYDNADMPAALACAERLGERLSLKSLSLCLSEALAWVNNLEVEAG